MLDFGNYFSLLPNLGKNLPENLILSEIMHIILVAHDTVVRGRSLRQGDRIAEAAFTLGRDCEALLDFYQTEHLTLQALPKETNNHLSIRCSISGDLRCFHHQNPTAL